MRLKHRFSEESLKIAVSIDSLFKLMFKESLPFVDTYESILKIDKGVLEAEMHILRNVVKESGDNIGFEILKKYVQKEMYPNIFKCFKLAASIPISSAACERSFSSMRRVKVWTRTTMTEDRFSDLSILHIEKEFIKTNVMKDDLLNRYKQKPRRIQLL